MQTDYLPAERYFLNWKCLLCCVTLFFLFAVLPLDSLLFSHFLEFIHILCKCALLNACVQRASSVFLSLCWPFPLHIMSLFSECSEISRRCFSKLYTLCCWLVLCMYVCVRASFFLVVFAIFLYWIQTSQPAIHPTYQLYKDLMIVSDGIE